MRNVIIVIFLSLSGLCISYYGVLDANNYLQKYKSLENRRHFTLYIDSDFTNEEREKIVKALDEWMLDVDNIDIKTEIRKISPFEMFHFGSDGMATIYKASKPGFKRDVGRVAANSYMAIGITLITSGDTFIFIDGDYFEHVVKHEMGHILIGFAWHSKNPESLMYPIATGKNITIMNEEIDLIRRNVYVYKP